MPPNIHRRSKTGRPAEIRAQDDQEHDGRPTPAREDRHNVANDNLETTVRVAQDERPRCARCKHPVWSAASLASGLGAECRRTVARGVAA